MAFLKMVNGEVLEMSVEEETLWLAEAAARPASMPQSLSFAQFIVGLVETGWITEAEGEAWLESSALPAFVAGVIAQIPAAGRGMEKPRLRAKARAWRPSTIERSNELLALMAKQRGATAEQLDELFRVYSQV